jgi:hypothetical protein
MCDLGSGQLGPSQAASEEDGNHGVIALSPECRTVENRKESRSLFHCELIANPGSMVLGAFHPVYSGREVG